MNEIEEYIKEQALFFNDIKFKFRQIYVALEKQDEVHDSLNIKDECSLSYLISELRRLMELFDDGYIMRLGTFIYENHEDDFAEEWENALTSQKKESQKIK